MSSKSTMVIVATADGPMQLFDAVPEGATRGAVIVMHDAVGVGPNIQVMCEMLADAGWRAAAPALYHRKGYVTVDIPSAGMEILGKVIEEDSHVLADLDATHRYLRSQGISPETIGLIGFCWGGRAAFLAAADRSLAACVSFYGTGIVEPVELPDVVFEAPQPPLIGSCATLKSPWLGIFAGDDPYIPQAEVEVLRAELEGKCPVDHAIRVYPGEDHAWVHIGVTSPADLQGSARDAWEKAIAFLESHV